jgi:glycogenin glucosyltransferase
LLNSFFKSWSTSDSSRRLPFLYNMTTNVSYSYAPAFMKFKDQVKIVHFIGINKPWYNTFNIDTQSVVSGAQEHENQFLNKWWIVFSQKVFNSLPDDVKARIGGQLVNNSGTIEGNVQKGAQGSGEWSGHGQSHCGHGGAPGVVIGSDQHQNLWETGQIEYTGRDSFSNIQAHLDSQLQKK